MFEASITDESKFKELLLKPEGFVIDFKSEQYRFDTNESKVKCVKDIISLFNTPRNRSAFIVLGVSDEQGIRHKKKHNNSNLSYEYGIDRLLDDQHFQTLVKDKVSPIPSFLYYIFTDSEGNKFGILEIFIVKGQDPTVPIKNFGNILKKDTIYRRLGSSNEEAINEHEKDKVISWFREVETQYWSDFYSACHKFEDRERLFILVSPPNISSASKDQIGLLGRINWSLVLDFDPDTESTGLFSYLKSEIQQYVHLLKLGDKQTFSLSASTYWFAARGLSGFQRTIVGDTWSEWNRRYSTYIRQLLTSFYQASVNKPATVVILWNDADYVSTLCEALDSIFADAINYVFASEDLAIISNAIKRFGSSFQASIIPITLPQIIDGIRKFTTSPNTTSIHEFWLPAIGKSSRTIPLNDFQWIQEDLEILHLNIVADVEPIAECEFYKGATISWIDLDLHRDAVRDVTASIIQQIKTDLKSRSTIRINLYHEAGAGGTTVARRVAWDLHQDYPTVLLKKIHTRETSSRIDAVKETHERIRKIYDRTEAPILVVVESSDVGLDDLEGLYTLIKSESLPVVFLTVQRRFSSSSSAEKRTFFLSSTLNESECRRFVQLYAEKVPSKKGDLERIQKTGNNQERTPFYLGLTSYGKEFISLPRYISQRLETSLGSEKDIIAYLAMVYHYTQRSLSSQIFASLSIPNGSRNKVIRLGSLLSQPLIELLISETELMWRPLHELIAVELLEQILSEGTQEKRNWNQKLTDYSIKFIELCAESNYIPTHETIDLLTRLFILKDYQEQIGKEEITDMVAFS